MLLKIKHRPLSFYISICMETITIYILSPPGYSRYSSSSPSWTFCAPLALSSSRAACHRPSAHHAPSSGLDQANHLSQLRFPREVGALRLASAAFPQAKPVPTPTCPAPACAQPSCLLPARLTCPSCQTPPPAATMVLAGVFLMIFLPVASIWTMYSPTYNTT